MTRHEAREQAFLLLFDKSFHPDMEVADVIALACEDGIVELDDFARGIVQKVCGAQNEIDAAIEKHLRGWRIGRISRVSQAALRLAVGELMFTDVPQGAVVNEAVELCKEYATSEDVSFVNGVLRSYLRAGENACGISE
ncbi:MAG: transcription antitermination factor NusB [Clostridia bacterium]|nr:transcription antitermination factor NusB [Clostridia bacterium]